MLFRSTLSQWMQSGALKRDSQPTIYYHTIEYVPPGADPKGPRKTLRGFIATFKLEEFGTGAIYPHENTRAAAKTDRLNLMEACRANFSPIWSLYSDPQDDILSALAQAAKSTAPCIEFRDDVGFEQRLWAISDPAVTGKVVAAMASKPIFIADGHHRYETALNYQKLRRQQAGQTGNVQGLQPYDSVLMLLTPIEDPGLTVLPTHRVTTTPLPSFDQVKTLFADTFDLQEYPFTSQTQTTVRRQFIDAMRTQGRATPMFGLALKGRDAYLTLSLKAAHRPPAGASPRAKLDVSLLQQLVVASRKSTRLNSSHMSESRMPSSA